MGDTLTYDTVEALRGFRGTLPNVLHRPFDVAVAQAIAGEFAVDVSGDHITFTGAGALVRFGPVDKFEEARHD